MSFSCSFLTTKLQLFYFSYTFIFNKHIFFQIYRLLYLDGQSVWHDWKWYHIITKVIIRGVRCWPSNGNQTRNRQNVFWIEILFICHQKNQDTWKYLHCFCDAANNDVISDTIFEVLSTATTKESWKKDIMFFSYSCLTTRPN